MHFKYKALKKSGEIFEEFAESADKFVLAKTIRDDGNVPLVITEVKDKVFSSAYINGLLGHVSLSEKIMFTKNLSGMLTAGLPLFRAIKVLEKQATNAEFKKIMGTIMDELDKGGTLSQGLEKYPKVFPPLFVSMIRSGEESGGLSAALKEIGQNMQKSYALNKKIKGALMYPMIILIAIVIIAVLMLIFVVPTLTKTFTDMGTKLPASTQFVISASDFMKQHYFAFAGIVFGLFITFKYLFRFKKVQRGADFAILRLPVIGFLVKEMNSARTARTLSSLLASGVAMTKSLEITKEVLQNSYYKDVIDNAIATVQKGGNLSKIFQDNDFLYPVMVGEMVEVGEETGNLSAMLVDIANFYEGEVDDRTKDLSTIIEPIMMIFIGAGVGFFAVSMITPMYSLMNNIG